MALPTAIFATVAAFGLASAAVVASVDTQRGTARDQGSKEAIAAADAGANVALLRLNRYASVLTVGTPCLGVNSSNTLVLTSADAGAPGWCPPVTGTVGTASYSYRVSAATASGSMAVVATGITPKASRRVAVSFKGTTIGGALSTDGLIGQDKVTIAGNGEVHVNMGTNGTVETQGNHSSACGNIRHGVGVPFGNVNQCAGYKVTEGNVAMPPVSSFMPTDIATNNSNYRLATCTQTTPTKVPSGCQTDTISGLSWSNSPWNATTRTISLSGKEPTLTLGGSDYFICKLEVTGGHLYMASDSHVRIFFDTPEHCGLAANTEQVRVAGNGSIEATAFDEKAGVFDMPGLYLLGSTTTPTRANFEGNGAANQFLLYAPNTAVRLAGNGASYAGAFVGKTIEVAGNGYVYQPAGYKPPPFGGSTLYARQSYVECTGATASPPNAGC